MNEEKPIGKEFEELLTFMIKHKVVDLTQTDQVKVRIVNKAWRNAHKTNQYGETVFSMREFRESLKAEHITLRFFKKKKIHMLPHFEGIMSYDEFLQWVFRPTEMDLKTEAYFEASAGLLPLDEIIAISSSL